MKDPIEREDAIKDIVNTPSKVVNVMVDSLCLDGAAFRQNEIIDILNDIPSAEKQGEWIPCSERLPEEHEWIGTKKFGTTISDEVYVTFESPKGERFTKHLSFQNGKVPSFKQKEIDVFYKGSVPIAWMPLPEPWKGADSETH